MDPTDTRFAQHVGIAEDTLAEIERIPAMIQSLDAANVTQNDMDGVVHRFATGWQQTWDQLKEARAIVVAKGRDASMFDKALAAAGDLYVDVAVCKVTDVIGAVELSWKNVSTSPAHAAISALRAAMPEVVIAKQAPLEVDLQPASGKVLWIAAVVGGVAFAGYVVWYGLIR